jgi:hypothetical protein
MRPAPAVLATLMLSLGLLGCSPRPDAPICTAASNCDPGEVCIDGACQACRTDADCDGQRCVEFRCTPEPDACTDDQTCTPGLRCVDSRCRGCTDASECVTGVCHPSGRCEPPPCSTDETCPQGEFCDGGQCLAVTPEPDADACGPSTIAFARDSAKLSPTQQQRLADATACWLARGSVLTLELRAGDDEALARRRAESVRGFLLGRGLADAGVRVSLTSGSGDEQVHVVATSPDP